MKVNANIFRDYAVFTKEGNEVSIVKDRFYTLKEAKEYARDNCAVDYCDFYIKSSISDTLFMSNGYGKWKIVK